MQRFSHLTLALAVCLLVIIAGNGCTAKVKASYHLKQAERYFNSSQYDLAVIEYKNVLRNSPQNSLAWSRLGTIYFNEGRLVEAAQFMARAQQLNTNNIEAHLKLGDIYLSVGELNDARNEANFILEKEPSNAEAPILLANAAATASEITNARQSLQKLSRAGETAPLEAAFGTLSWHQQDIKTAEADFKRAAVLDPKFSEAYSALGNLYIAQKDLKAADQALKTAMTLSPPGSEQALHYAQFEIVTGNPDAGQLLLQDIVKKAPYNLSAWIALAELAAAEKKYADGITLLDNVFGRDPENFQGLLLKGRLELQEGKTMEAINNFEEMAKLYPKVPVIYYQLAQARLANNQADQAMSNLNQALNLNPRYADAIISLAQIQIRNGNVAPAIVSLQQLTQQQPQITSARLLLAEAYRAQGRLDRVSQIYHDLELAYPKNPQFPLLLGITLLQQKQNAEAHIQYDQALKLAPDYFPAVEQIVNLDLTEGQSTAAQQLVQQEMKQNPKVVPLQLLLANTQIARGETNQAENTLLKAIDLQPDLDQAYLLLAHIYVTANQNEKALAELKTVLERNPKNLSALMFIGSIYSAEKDFTDSRDAYEKLLALAPNNAGALNNLACLYSDHLNQLDKGYQLAQKAHDLVPTDPSLADTLGWILCQKGQYASAVSLLQESAPKLSTMPDVQFHLGMAYYLMGDEANARSAFQRSLQLNKDFPEKNECNQCLTVLAIDANTAGVDTRSWLENKVTENPKDSIALMRLAAMYQHGGMTDKAIATYQVALQANPQNVTALLNLSQLQASKDPQAALNLAKAAYSLTPNDPLVIHTLGRLAFQTGDYPWALSLLQLTARAQPQDPDVLYDLAEAFYSVGRVPDARNAMQRALQTNAAFSRTQEAERFLALTDTTYKADQALSEQSQVISVLKSEPNYVPALMIEAAIAEQKNDTATAQQTYQDVLRIYPDFAPAQRKLAILYAANPDNDAQAYPLATKAYLAFPNDATLANSLGMIVCRQGDYARAVNLLQVGATPSSQDSQLLYYLGLAQYHLKQSQKSKATLQRALALDLSGKDAAHAKLILAELR